MIYSDIWKPVEKEINAAIAAVKDVLSDPNISNEEVWNPDEYAMVSKAELAIEEADKAIAQAKIRLLFAYGKQVMRAGKKSKIAENGTETLLQSDTVDTLAKIVAGFYPHEPLNVRMAAAALLGPMVLISPSLVTVKLVAMMSSLAERGRMPDCSIDDLMIGKSAHTLLGSITLASDGPAAYQAFSHTL
jgi:hypothetical protein